jgi:hypothetical protein
MRGFVKKVFPRAAVICPSKKALSKNQPKEAGETSDNCTIEDAYGAGKISHTAVVAAVSVFIKDN